MPSFPFSPFCHYSLFSRLQIADPRFYRNLISGIGEHNTGKSTLVSALSSSSSVAGPSSESLDKPPASNGDQDSNPAKVEHQDLGLSYNYIDIGDESDEGGSEAP